MNGLELERALVVYAGLPADHLKQLEGMRIAKVLRKTALNKNNRKGFIRELLAPELHLGMWRVSRMTLREIYQLLTE